MIAAISPEDQLCLLLARGPLTLDQQARVVQILASPLRWPLILDRAYTHEIYPLLYRNLRALGFPGVPSAVQAELKGAYLTNAFRNQVLAEEFGRLLSLLGEAGVPVIPLKGVTLAQSLFGDPAARVCADIDILVPVNEVLRARRIILSSGYTSPFTENFFLHHQFHTTADCALFRDRDKDKNYKSKDAVYYLVEVHWTLLQHSSKDTEAMAELWSQARPQDFFPSADFVRTKDRSGIRAFNPTPEWQFLYLSAHAAYHRWNKLKWLADIHQLCVSGSYGQNLDSAQRLDWNKIKEKAGRFELDLLAETTLTACTSLFGTPLPPNLSPRPLPPHVRLFPDSLVASESWNVPLFYPRLLKRPSEKLRWFGQMLFVPRMADYRFLNLPASLSLVYYFLRPLRLTCKWGWAFVQAGLMRLMNMKLVG